MNTCSVINIVVGLVCLVIGFVIGRVTASGKPCGCKASAAPKKEAVTKKEEKPFEKRKPHPAPTDGSVEIYVGNLNYDMTEDQLRAEFTAFGAVNNVRLITHKPSGRSKGYAFVNMPVRAEAEKACAALNDKEIMGRKITCNEAKNLV